jgi:SAM-dependent methyltransferase
LGKSQYLFVLDVSLRGFFVAEVFSDYARYYDLLYKDKDYAGETAYVHALIQKYKLGAKSILNLGCGTGKHDACLQKLGYEICGVDLSETMLVEAHKRAIPGKLEFFHGDARTVDLGRKFDIVVSLFHVMSYQTTDEDVLSAFKTANRHLKEGGLFIFDFWHGEGVLSDPPSLRVRKLEDDIVSIIRTANPVMHRERDVIDVNYEIHARDKKSGCESELRETHTMRYFFLAGLKSFLLEAGFEVKDSLAWMTDKPLGLSWYGVVAAVKKGGC